MMMDSNAVGKFIHMMMMSNSSGCENDEVAEAAAGEKKRRFSEAQVKSLEVMFEAQAKLEPRKKQELAKELGLQPRQVAIWFQNKRARWKSKQLERAYASLSADYDALRSSFDSLLHQKNALSMQVQKLAEMLEAMPKEKKASCKNIGGGDADQTPFLSLSSNTNKSDMEIKNTDEKEHRLSNTEVSERSEQQLICFHDSGWPSDHVMAGGGYSQWWEFLTYE